jgi:hypothetical protein
MPSQHRRGIVTPVVNENDAVQVAVASAIKALRASLPKSTTRYSQDDIDKKFVLACVDILKGRTEYDIAPICHLANIPKLSISPIPDISSSGKVSCWDFRSMTIKCTTKRYFNGREDQFPLQADEVFGTGIFLPLIFSFNFGFCYFSVHSVL